MLSSPLKVVEIQKQQRHGEVLAFAGLVLKFLSVVLTFLIWFNFLWIRKTYF